MHDVTNQTSASSEQTLRSGEAIKADPGICSRNVERYERIEPVREGGFVRQRADSSALSNSVDELIKPMLPWSFGDEWMSEHGHSGGAMVVQEPDQWLCGSVCMTAGNDDERPAVDRNAAGSAERAHGRGHVGRTHDITMAKGYRHGAQ